ncbi:MAG: hypothetical protein IJF22_00565 [Clostridia bacterium]|nr:hypothetical protein [Clostridia bacterium]
MRAKIDKEIIVRYTYKNNKPLIYFYPLVLLTVEEYKLLIKEFKNELKSQKKLIKENKKYAAKSFRNKRY